ncbi:succinylglutamate desuccinylase/aspartoacylase domain-containing protein [Methanobacterium alcaliphilum]|uniref:succinylglutamate desuccinylase/aspartoacylase domain-containing protein n=1 Tax=Methanobacterium alcaliphilum TaxID=392018 RepID=UPI00200B8FBF|nr:succinylglutamate desuccinylase/aspartoacylase family protein [Methanobacterium alcaliphilum]MCK9151515.1 succinylglutamate desuccinylase/aspartoacylase family protein [Methanobacterium alcaliphilum]
MNQKIKIIAIFFLGLFISFNMIEMSHAVKIDIINSNTGGDVTKNKLIKKYIPKTNITNQVVEAAKKGTPMVTFGNGKGPRVLIVAGVHGNELPSQIAAVKLINYLQGKKIRGTVYIIPFAIPSNTAKTKRYWKGRSPNAIAQYSGTPTNKIVKLAKKLKIDAMGDFHCTRPIGYPGKSAILYTKYPEYQSYKMAKYMSKKSKSALKGYKKAGFYFKGALEDVCNLNGVPSVTAEALSWHGTVKKGSVTKSFSQMNALLKYKKVI